MTSGLQRWHSILTMFRMLTAVLYLYTAYGETPTSHSPLAVSSPHVFYTCPEGATVRLECSQSGARQHPTDILKHHWLFTPYLNQHCSNRVGPRHMVLVGHGNHSTPPGVRFAADQHSFWVELQNVSREDQGKYCCLLLDIMVEKQHATFLQKPHSHVALYITPRRNGSQECTIDTKQFPESSMGAVLATAACIVALLSLPIILVLVYKQRNTQSSRRAHELVRMDSEAHGHENPVFMRSSPESRMRTVSQIMTRQASETGRHLLSDPGTPVSPITHGDVFFPAQDPIPESPVFMQV